METEREDFERGDKVDTVNGLGIVVDFWGPCDEIVVVELYSGRFEFRAVDIVRVD